MTERAAPPPEPGSRSTPRALGWGALALGLVAVVAMAAHGAVWSTTPDASARTLPHAVIVGGGIAVIVLAVVVLVAALAVSRAGETPEQRRRRWVTAVSFLIVVALLSIVRVMFSPSHPRAAAPPPTSAPTDTRRRVTPPRGPNRETPATWWPLVILGLGTAAIFVSATTHRARRRVGEAPDDPTTVELLDASLDDLRSEPDPRRAIVAAYARMERGLAARGFARTPAETPTEYLRRALDARATGGTSGTPIAVDPLRDLTALAERARFSVAPIDEAMRERAIAALRALRAELGTADARPRAIG